MKCQTLFKPLLYCLLIVLIMLSTQVLAQPPSSPRGGLYGDWQIKYQTGESQREAIISFSRDREGNRTGQWISFMSLSELKDFKYEDGKLSFIVRVKPQHPSSPVLFRMAFCPEPCRVTEESISSRVNRCREYPVQSGHGK